jgi:hypothetical protein
MKKTTAKIANCLGLAFLGIGMTYYFVLWLKAGMNLSTDLEKLNVYWPAILLVALGGVLLVIPSITKND